MQSPPESHTLLATKYTKVTYLVSLLTFYGLPNISILRFLKKGYMKISTFEGFEDLFVSFVYSYLIVRMYTALVWLRFGQKQFR